MAVTVLVSDPALVRVIFTFSFVLSYAKAAEFTYLSVLSLAGNLILISLPLIVAIVVIELRVKVVSLAAATSAQVPSWRKNFFVVVSFGNFGKIPGVVLETFGKLAVTVAVSEPARVNVILRGLFALLVVSSLNDALFTYLSVSVLTTVSVPVVNLVTWP